MRPFLLFVKSLMLVGLFKTIRIIDNSKCPDMTLLLQKSEKKFAGEVARGSARMTSITVERLRRDSDTASQMLYRFFYYFLSRAARLASISSSVTS